MRFAGVLKSWQDERGFGFIAPEQGGQEIFVHIKACRFRGARPQVGQSVTFEVETQGAARGKPASGPKTSNWRRRHRAPPVESTARSIKAPHMKAGLAVGVPVPLALPDGGESTTSRF
jgi:cold shock CspA family protein